MRHTHLFKNIGGGCLIGDDKRWLCDDHYRCQCGAEFKLKTSLEGHTYLPESFESQEKSEVKEAELKAIHDAFEGNLNPKETLDEQNQS